MKKLPDTLPPPPEEIFAEALLEVAEALDALSDKSERLHAEALRAIAPVKKSVENEYDRSIAIEKSLSLVLDGIGEIRSILEARDQDDEQFRKNVAERLARLERAQKGSGNGAHQ